MCTCVARREDNHRYDLLRSQYFDKRPDQSRPDRRHRSRGEALAIVDAGGKWNTYEITAKGPQLTVRLNGTVTAQAEDRKLISGPIALQYMAGTVRFRRVQIKRL